MLPHSDVFSSYARTYETRRDSEMSLAELEGCRDDPMMYATTLDASSRRYGEAELVDTARDARLGRIFMNRTIRTYPAFAEFYGMEETIERISSASSGTQPTSWKKAEAHFFTFLAPVGGGKSSLAERLKALVELKNRSPCSQGGR